MIETRPPLPVGESGEAGTAFCPGQESATMTGHEAKVRLEGAMFEGNNRLAFDRAVDAAARAWWLAAFYEPYGLTPEGMGDLITRSVPQDKSIRYYLIDGSGEAFRLRVEGKFSDEGEIWFVERTLVLAGRMFEAGRRILARHAGRAHRRTLPGGT